MHVLFWIRNRIAWAAAGLLVYGIPAMAHASTFTIVGQIGDPRKDDQGYVSDGAVDANGNLYFEADGFAAATFGGLYILKAKSGYHRVEELFQFTPSLANPLRPYYGVVLNKTGDIFGPSFDGTDPYGLGTVFSLGKPTAISLSVLHGFAGSTADGESPGDLAAGSDNKYYGATNTGGIGSSADPLTGNGTIFGFRALATDPDYKVLYRFGAISGDGITPTEYKLAVDPSGRLYGVTYKGGANGGGTVFMLQYGDTGWQEQVLYSFAAPTTHKLHSPTANVVLDAAGNLYGCGQGGNYGQGGMFELSPPTIIGAPWQEQVLYEFGRKPHDPVAAEAAVAGSPTPPSGCGIALDQKSGLIVGTSHGGGLYSRGTIFTLTPPVSGAANWKEKVSYSFKLDIQTGFYPVMPPLEVNGVYYGSTSMGRGAIYAFVP